MLSAIYCIFLYEQQEKQHSFLLLHRVTCGTLRFAFVYYRVTVGVVIGVADLIVPETNIGEVGQRITSPYK